MHQSLTANTVKIRPFMPSDKPAHSADRSRSIRQTRRQGNALRTLRRNRLAQISGVR